MPPELRPRDQELDALLRRCVECGLCLPHCATWLETGNEVQSPRGRLALLNHLHGEGDLEAPRAFLEAFDLCIGCRACEAVCPSGVPFQLLEGGQALAAGRLVRPSVRGLGILSGGFFLRRLDSVHFLKFLGKFGGFGRRMLALFLGSHWRQKLDKGPARKLARLLGSMPTVPSSDGRLREILDRKCGFDSLPDPGPNRFLPETRSANQKRVAFFTGCANAGLMAPTSRRLRDLLEAAGCEVTLVGGQDCCGALAGHDGRPGRAASLRRRNQAAFAPYLSGNWCILTEAAGCGLEFQEQYAHDFASRVTDAVVLLAQLDLPRMGEVPLKVVYHDPCHARHGQGIIAEPRRLLDNVPGLLLTEPLEPEVCCGSGGSWGLKHPELSAQLGRRKAVDLAVTGADLVLTSNPGCLGQIADGLALEAPEVPILPLTDLLWYAWQKGMVARLDSR